MSTAGDALHGALRALLGHRVEVVRHDQPTYRRLLDLFGSNAAIAGAAGFPTAAAAKRAGRDPGGARRRRQSFLRNLQRYANGSRHPKQLEPLLRRVEERGYVDRGIYRTYAGLASVIAAQGVTVEGRLDFTDTYDDRERTIKPCVSWRITERLRALIAAETWPAAGDQFFVEYGQAYGVGGGFGVEDVEGLELSLGMRSECYAYPVAG